MLIAAPRFTDRASIGAKTLSGYGYRHHTFWDTETFMLPMFSYTQPDVAKNMLAYRWHNLAGARAKAAGNGYQGAQYPWESAADGVAVTGAHHVRLSATAGHDTTTTAKTGAKAPTGVAPAVAITISNVTTSARIGTGATLVASGDICLLYTSRCV